MATTPGTATAKGVESERGGNDGGSGAQFLEAAIEHAPDQGGMVWDTHGRLAEEAILYIYQSDIGKTAKMPGAQKN